MLKKQEREQLVAALANFSPAYLGRAILQTYSVQPARKFQISRALAWLRNHALDFLQVNCSVPLQLYDRETRMLLFLFGVISIGLMPILMTILLSMFISFSLFGGIVGTLLSAGRVYDPLPHRVRPRPDVPLLRRQFLEAIQPVITDGGRSVFELRRLDRMILAQQIVRGETSLLQHSGRSGARVLRGLARSGALPKPTDVIAAVMGDRVLLESALQVAVSSGERIGQREISVDNDRDQLLATLPLRPPLLSFVLLLVLSWTTLAMWLAILNFLIAPDLRPWLWKYQAPAAACLCVILSLSQHVPRLRQWTLTGGPGNKSAIPFSQPRAFLAIVLIGFVQYRLFKTALVSHVVLPKPGNSGEWLYFILSVMPIWIASLIVPELIARWRGAGLFYPTRPQLWSHRLVSAGLFVAACAVIALVAGTLSRF